jgi:hypothetical protein
VKYRLAMLTALASAGFSAARADASEWGCEVLLCAASSNPSWRGVESCHPPMERLISAMKKPGFSWPTCPEGGAGAPGYEKYAECPAGWTPTAGDNDQRPRAERGQSRCMRAVIQCNGRRRFVGSPNAGGIEITADGVTRVFSRTNACSYIEYTARPLRNDPYHFDINDESTGQSSRFWFNLEK